jgi:hypothetical protein
VCPPDPGRSAARLSRPRPPRSWSPAVRAGRTPAADRWLTFGGGAARLDSSSAGVTPSSVRASWFAPVDGLPTHDVRRAIAPERDRVLWRERRRLDVERRR